MYDKTAGSSSSEQSLSKASVERISVEEIEGNLPGTMRKCAGGTDAEPGRFPYHHVASFFKREGFFHAENDAAESWPQTKWRSPANAPKVW